MTSKRPHWPAWVPRTPDHEREPARFTVTLRDARSDLLHELETMGTSDVVITQQRWEPGIAVWFTYRGQAYVVVCDRWDYPADNLRAIGLSIAAIRTMRRCGLEDAADRALSGFRVPPGDLRDEPAPNPAPAHEHWSAVFGVSPDADLATVKRVYRAMVREAHPDLGGTDAATARLNRAMADAELEIGLGLSEELRNHG